MIRRATDADKPAVGDVYLRARKANTDIPPSVHPDDDVREWFAGLVDRNEVWVATDDVPTDADTAGTGEVVAILIVEDDWVEHLYVLAEHTGRGIGSALLDVAKQARPDGLQLWAFQSNTRAIRFYEREGFTEAERTDGDNVEGEPDVRLVWRPSS